MKATKVSPRKGLTLLDSILALVILVAITAGMYGAFSALSENRIQNDTSTAEEAVRTVNQAFAAEGLRPDGLGGNNPMAGASSIVMASTDHNTVERAGVSTVQGITTSTVDADRRVNADEERSTGMGYQIELAGGAVADQVATPLIDPPSGIYESDLPTAGGVITITSSTPGATIRYTIGRNDGAPPSVADPDAGSSLYSTPIDPPIAPPEETYVTVKAQAFRSGWEPSDIASATYQLISRPEVVPPSINPASGEYQRSLPSGGRIFMSTTETGARIHYTIAYHNSSQPSVADPTMSSNRYSSGFAPDANYDFITVKARTFKKFGHWGWVSSPVTKRTYQIRRILAPPIINYPNGQMQWSWFNSSGPNNLSGVFSAPNPSNPAGTEYRYTTNGATPSEASPIWNFSNTYNPATFPAMIQIRAFASGYTPSPAEARTWTPPAFPVVSFVREKGGTSNSIDWIEANNQSNRLGFDFSTLSSWQHDYFDIVYAYQSGTINPSLGVSSRKYSGWFQPANDEWGFPNTRLSAGVLFKNPNFSNEQRFGSRTNLTLDFRPSLPVHIYYDTRPDLGSSVGKVNLSEPNSLRRPTLTWTPFPGSTWTLIQVYKEGTLIINDWVEAYELSSYTVASDLEDGSYQWWVMGWNSYGGHWSSERTFSVSSVPSNAYKKWRWREAGERWSSPISTGGRPNYLIPGKRYEFEVDIRSKSPNIFVSVWAKPEINFDWGMTEPITLETTKPISRFALTTPGVISKTMPSDFPRTGYMWWEAVGAGGAGGPAKFQRYTGKAGSPTTGVYSHTFTWPRIPNADDVLLVVNHNGVGWYSEWLGSNRSSFTLNTVFYAGNYEWWVRGWRKKGNTYMPWKPSYSSGWTFSYQNRPNEALGGLIYAGMGGMGGQFKKGVLEVHAGDTVRAEVGEGTVSKGVMELQGALNADGIRIGYEGWRHGGQTNDDFTTIYSRYRTMAPTVGAAPSEEILSGSPGLPSDWANMPGFRGGSFGGNGAMRRAFNQGNTTIGYIGKATKLPNDTPYPFSRFTPGWEGYGNKIRNDGGANNDGVGGSARDFDSSVWNSWTEYVAGFDGNKFNGQTGGGGGGAGMILTRSEWEDKSDRNLWLTRDYKKQGDEGVASWTDWVVPHLQSSVGSWPRFTFYSQGQPGGGYWVNSATWDRSFWFSMGGGSRGGGYGAGGGGAGIGQNALDEMKWKAWAESIHWGVPSVLGDELDEGSTGAQVWYW